MKIFIALLSTFIFSNSAFSCVKFSNQDFCVGDSAIVGESDGTIVGVNKTKISVDFTGGSTQKKGIETVDIEKVFLGKGCLEEFCVGGNGVGENIAGEIVGLNAVSEKIAINHKRASDKYSHIKIHDVKKSSVGNGCLESYCVSDYATFKSSDGTIVGINTNARTISIRFAGGTTKFVGIGTYEIKTVSIGKGCFNGYCVGDKAVTGKVDGIIIGINPYRGEASVKGSEIVTAELKNVTMRSLNESVHANDPKRVISNIADFNHSFGK